MSWRTFAVVVSLIVGCASTTPEVSDPGPEDTDTVADEGTPDGGDSPDSQDTDGTEPDGGTPGPVDAPDTKIPDSADSSVPVPCAVLTDLSEGVPLPGVLGSASAINSYSCDGTAASGPEVIYSYTTECGAGTLTVSAGHEVGSSSPVRVSVLSACDGQTCLATSPGAGAASLTLETEADTTYFIVLEGQAGDTVVLASDSACCVPQCTGADGPLECGDDGCGGQCGTCTAPQVCTDEGLCLCTADCTDKACGDDGCGGDCGACSAPEVCTDAGQCICTPSCQDKACGEDGCGAFCGTCTDDDICVEGSCECVPQCDGQVCGEDGCGGSCGQCAPLEICDGVSCLCLPTCDDKVCGPNGCGGSCGACSDGTGCADDGQCTCTPNCLDQTCGDDGCGGSCGGCSVGDVCVDGGCTCVADCTDNECGDNGCGAACGQCDAGSICLFDQCVCVPKCQGKMCGDDGCGGACGTCQDNELCTDSQCVCIPSCEGTVCGDDGCGGSCGDCSATQVCAAGQCQCAPQCSGPTGPKACGDDACGSTCGVCLEGAFCNEFFACELTGDQCTSAEPLPLSSLITASTAGFDADYSGNGCGTYGDLAGDRVYALSVDASRPYGVAFASDGWTGSVGVTQDCGQPAQCVALSGGEGTATLTAGPWFLVVDGAADTDQTGPFSLEWFIPGASCEHAIKVPGVAFEHTASAAGYATTSACGGAGPAGRHSFVPQHTGWWTLTVDSGVLGVGVGCGGDETCLGDGSSVDLPLTAGLEYTVTTHATAPDYVLAGVPTGDICDNALPLLPGVPFTSSTAGYSNAYQSAVGCAGEGDAHGAQHAEVTFALTAPTDGVYRISLDTVGFAGALVLAQDCDDIDGSCLAAVSASLFDVELGAGEQTFLLVDGAGAEAADGDFTIRWDLVGGGCEAPGQVPGSGFSQAGTTAGYPDGIVRYTLTPTGAGPWVFETTGATLSLSTSCDGSTLDTSAPVVLTPGGTYWLAVQGAGAYSVSGTQVGDSCAVPKPLLAGVPTGGTTAGLSDQYQQSSKTCKGDPTPHGIVGPELVYAFECTSSGAYEIYWEPEAGYDAAIYIATDCSDIPGTCIHNTTSFAVNANFLAGQTYYVFVDGAEIESAGAAHTLSLMQICAGSCDGKACGDDGCGGWCGDCPEGQGCANDFTCQCAPDCFGKICGADGCGGFCGECPGGTACNGGFWACVGPGETCENPTPLDGSSLPITVQDDTTNGSNDELPAPGCEGAGGVQGIASPDHVYTVTVESSGRFEITMTPEPTFDPFLYVQTACDAGCLASADVVGDGVPETLQVDLTAGQTILITADGWGDQNVAQGSYSLHIAQLCTLDCTDNICGEDGCGGECGTCPAASTCSLAQDQCLQDGETCESPTVIAPAELPTTLLGDTSGLADALATMGICGAIPAGSGSGSEDVVYSVTPITDTDYTFTLTSASGPDLLYVLPGCSVPAPACVGGATEGSVTVALEAGTAYAVVVDGSAGQTGTFELAVCAADCGGYGAPFKVCNADGCGGTCGGCQSSEVCSADQTACQVAGDTCANPIVVPAASLPFDSANDPAAFQDDVDTEGCGSGSGVDVAYQFTPDAAGTYWIGLTSGYGTDSASVVVSTSCSDPASDCVAAIDLSASNHTIAPLTAGTQYTIQVEGTDAPFTFRIERLGASCDSPIVIDAATLPYESAGDTTGFPSAQEPSVCALSGGFGRPDVVYEFTPTTTGDYVFSNPVYGQTPTPGPSIMYLVDSCSGGATCLGGADFFGNQPDQFTANLTAGQTVYVVVDSYGAGEVGPYALKVEAAP